MSDPAVVYKLALQDDPLNSLRSEFVIPTNRQMKATAVDPNYGARPQCSADLLFHPHDLVYS